MKRRQFNSTIGQSVVLIILAAHAKAHALSLADLSMGDASKGVKTALERCAIAAVGLLGQTDGFLGNDKVRIGLPGFLDDAAKVMKTLGQGKRVDELITSNMSVGDARKILAGGDTSVTTFFADKTRSPLSEKFLPVVTRVTEKVGLTNKFNQFAGKAAGMGLLKKEDANIQQYVTGKSLDGLYLIIGEEEKKIRQDPVGTGSAILKKVFGAVK